MSLIKKSAATAVATLETQAESLSDYLTALTSSQPDHRRQAAIRLAQFAEAGPYLLKALAIEDIRAVREAMLSTLIKIGDADCVSALSDYLRSDEVSLRNEVFEALKARASLSIPVTQSLLKDDDPDVRIYAVNLLEEMHDPAVEQTLLEVLAHETHVNVCATVVNLLGEIGTVACVPVLTQLKNRFADEPYICFAADLTLGRLHAH